MWITLHCMACIPYSSTLATVLKNLVTEHWTFTINHIYVLTSNHWFYCEMISHFQLLLTYTYMYTHVKGNTIKIKCKNKITGSSVDSTSYIIENILKQLWIWYFYILMTFSVSINTSEKISLKYMNGRQYTSNFEFYLIFELFTHGK